MKKYVKPELFYERYELSQHIADCAFELNQGDVSTCSAVMDLDFSVTNGIPTGVKYFAGASDCQVTPQIYCYTNGAPSVATFVS